MGTREVRLEELLGRRVVSAAGRPIGRIDDLRARPHGDEYLVHEVLLGELGLLPRLLRLAERLPTFQALSLGRRYRRRAIPWHWLDFSDPQRPRFRQATRLQGGPDG